MKKGDGIGRILMIVFDEQDLPVFDEMMEVLRCYPDFEYVQMDAEMIYTFERMMEQVWSV